MRRETPPSPNAGSRHRPHHLANEANLCFPSHIGACSRTVSSMLCPFLRNIHEPTNFSFASSLSFPNAVPGAKGPIFEDGPNIDMAFRLFHGRDGIVPLSGRRSAAALDEDLEQEQLAKPPRFNSLAAKAATIACRGSEGLLGLISLLRNGTSVTRSMIRVPSEWLRSWRERCPENSVRSRGSDQSATQDDEWRLYENGSEIEETDDSTTLKNVLLVTGPIGGKKIRCSTSQAKHHSFIGNVPRNWVEDDLKKVVTDVGPGATKVDLMQDPNNSSHNRGFAFVEYYNHACAEYSRKKCL